MSAPTMAELTAADAVAQAALESWIATVEASRRNAEPEVAVAALRTELLATAGNDVGYLSALAAHAIGRLAESRRWPTGQRHMTREVVEDIAEEAEAKRREDV